MLPDGTTVSTQILSDGQEFVFSGGVASFTTVSLGGTETVSSGGAAVSTTISSGGFEFVSQGGNGSFTTVSAGGTEYVFDGGSATSDTISALGNVRVIAGGTEIDATAKGGLAQITITLDGIASGTTVSAGAFEVVSSGGSAVATTVSANGNVIVDGGTIISTTDIGGLAQDTVSSGGVASFTTVSAGAIELVRLGGVASDTRLTGFGAWQQISAGGSAVSTTVSAYATQYVSSGGVASFTVVSNAGDQIVYASGTAVSTTLAYFGAETVSMGGSASFTVVSNSATENLYGSAFGDTVLSGGTENVLSAGVASDTTVSSGGLQIIDRYGTAIGTVVSNGGVVFVVDPPSGTPSTSDSTIDSGGAEIVSSGGAAYDTTVNAGGYLVILPGGTQTGTISAGGEVVSTGVVLYQPGSGVTYFGSSATDIQVGSGSPFTTATEYVLSGGTAISNTVIRGGAQYLYSGGIASDTLLSGNTFGGGFQYVSSGGVVISTSVTAEATEDVYSGGATTATNVYGGEEEVFAGGSSLDTTLTTNPSGSIEVVEGNFNLGVTSSGTATSTTVSSGGHLEVAAYGFASATTVSSGGFEVVSAFASATSTTLELGGSIDLTDVRFVSGGAVVASLNSATDVLSVTSSGSVVYTQQLEGNYTGFYFNTAAGPITGLDTLITASETPCYCRGTLILTDRGEVPVEDLRIGDRLVTLSGAIRPIRWIGRRSYDGRFAAGNRKVLPVLFRRASLTDDSPRRDLLVSPLHAMFLDGMLIPASALVNGTSIVQLEAIDRVEYIHIELDTHDVILAEGAASETFIDDDSRGMFHNAAEFHLLYPDAPRRPARFCAPRVEDGAALEAVRNRLIARANGAAVVEEPVSSETLRGYLDHVAADRIQGWAHDPASPGQPVRLRILDNDVVIGEVLADRYRFDLARNGIGDGRHGFAFDIPGGLSPLVRHVIRVQRVTDGAELTDSPWLVSAAPMVLTAPATQQGDLRGHVDLAARDRIVGWAQSAADPKAPVALQILDNGVPVTRVVANVARDDLAAAGIGDGRHGFDLLIPGGLSPLVRHVIQIRRDTDGAELPGSPAVIEAAGTFDAGLQRAVAGAVAATASDDDRQRVLSFMLEQTERLLQQRADADARRAERMIHQRLARRLGPQAEAPAAPPQPRALVIDARVPMAGRDAGSQAILSHMQGLQALGYAVSFIAADQMAASGPGVAALGTAGIAWCGAPFYASAEEVLQRQAGCFDLVYLHRAAIATRYLGLARRYVPKARILYSVADLHHVRLERQAAVEDRPELLAASRRQLLEECVAAWSADAVLAHAPEEVARLRTLVPEARVHHVPWAVTQRIAAPCGTQRHGIAFVGGYAHAPNVDAAVWLIEAVMPLVWRHDPALTCLLAGSDMPEAVRRLARPGVEVLGEVADLGRVFDRVRLSVAPLRYGAGVKGKVLDSLASGVPCVMTPVAAEGLALPPELRALVGADPAELAALILTLHGDADARLMAAQAGRAMLHTHHTEATVFAALRAAVEACGLPVAAHGPAAIAAGL